MVAGHHRFAGVWQCGGGPGITISKKVVFGGNPHGPDLAFIPASMDDDGPFESKPILGFCLRLPELFDWA